MQMQAQYQAMMQGQANNNMMLGQQGGNGNFMNPNKNTGRKKPTNHFLAELRRNGGEHGKNQLASSRAELLKNTNGLGPIKNRINRNRANAEIKTTEPVRTTTVSSELSWDDDSVQITLEETTPETMIDATTTSSLDDEITVIKFFLF